MVEMCVSMLVLIVAVGAGLGAMSSFVGLEDSNRETVTAYLAARRQIETLQAADFSGLFVEFNTAGADDPGGAGTSPGAGFVVPGLDLRDGDGDGMVGRIVLPEDAADATILREDLNDRGFGMPRDLTADGVADAVDHSSDYQVLPVRVRIEWRGSSGNRFIELQALLTARGS
jgi:hypothetical protein